MLQRVTADITTDSSQNATVRLGKRLRGRLVQIVYRPSFMKNGDASSAPLDTGADLTITTEQDIPAPPSGPASPSIPAGTPILTKINLGTGTSFLYPRAKPTIANDATGGLGSVPSEMIPLVNECVKVVVAQGGATKSGSIEIVYDSETGNS